MSVYYDYIKEEEERLKQNEDFLLNYNSFLDKELSKEETYRPIKEKTPLTYSILGNIRDEWNSATEDAKKVATSAQGKKADVVAPSVGIGTRYVLAPMSGTFGGIFNNFIKEPEYGGTSGGVVESTLSILQGVEEYGSKFLGEIGASATEKVGGLFGQDTKLSDFSKKQLGQGLFNIGTGVIGESIVGGAIKGARGTKSVSGATKATSVVEPPAFFKGVKRVEKTIDDLIELNNKTKEDYSVQSFGKIKEGLEDLKTSIKNGTETETSLKENLDRIKMGDYYSTVKKEMDDYYEVKKDIDVNQEVERAILNSTKDKDFKPFNYKKPEEYFKLRESYDNFNVGRFELNKTDGLGIIDYKKDNKALASFFKENNLDLEAQNKFLDNFKVDKSNDPVFKLAELYNYQQRKKTEGELGMSLRDTEGNLEKANLILDLQEDGIIKMRTSTTEGLNQYVLTTKGKLYSKGLGFSDAEIKKVSEVGLVEHQKSYVDAAKKERVGTTKVDKPLDKIKQAKNTLNKINDLYVRGDNSIINIIKKFNDVYKVIPENLIESLVKDGKLNTDKLTTVINKINEASTTNFIKGVPSKRNTIRSIIREVQKLGESKGISKYSKTLSKNIKEWNTKLKRLKRDNSLNKKIAEVKSKTIIKNINNAKFRQAVLFKNVTKAKYLLLKGIKIDIRNGLLSKEVYEIFKKNPVKQEFLGAKTLEDFEKVSKKLNDEVNNLHRKGVIKDIKKEISKRIDVSKSSSPTKKKEMSIGARKDLEEIAEIFNRGATDTVSTRTLEDLLHKVKEGIKDDMARQHMEKISNLEKFYNLVKKEKHKFKKIEGIADIKDIEGMTGRISKIAKSFHYNTQQIFFLFQQMFGQNSKVRSLFVNKTRRLHNEFELFYKNHTLTTIEKLDEYLGEDVLNFGTALLARQVDSNGLNIGIHKIIWDPENKGRLLAKGKTHIDCPDRIDMDLWDEIKNTKLGEIIERFEIDEKWTKPKALWKSYADLVYSKSRKLSLEYEGIDLPYREYYMHLQVNKKHNNAEIKGFDDTPELFTKIADGHTKDVVDTRGKNIVYEHNPLTVLLGDGRKQVYRVYMKQHYDELKALIEGRTYTLKNVADTEIDRMMSDSNFELQTLAGETLDKTTVKDGTIKVKNKEDEWITYKLEDLQFKNTGEGIRDLVGREGAVQIQKFMDTMSKGGNFPKHMGEFVLSKIANNYNILPIVGNAGTIIKQLLSLVDAAGILGFIDVTKNIGELFSDPRSFKYLEDNVPSIKTRAADIITKEEISYKSYQKEIPYKVKWVFDKYKEFGTLPMREVDKYVYTAIWYSAYKNAAKKAGKSYKIGDELDLELTSKADDRAEMIAGTANPHMQPNMYKHTVNKMFFGLFSTQLTRINNLKSYTAILKNNKEYGQLTRFITYTFAVNLAEAYITYAVGKALFGLGLSTYDGYEKDYLELNSLNSVLYDATIGQTFVGGKLGGLTKGYGFSPATDGLEGLKDSINLAYNRDGWKGLENLFETQFGGHMGKRLVDAYKNYVLDK